MRLQHNRGCSRKTPSFGIDLFDRISRGSDGSDACPDSEYDLEFWPIFRLTCRHFPCQILVPSRQLSFPFALILLLQIFSHHAFEQRLEISQNLIAMTCLDDGIANADPMPMICAEHAREQEAPDAAAPATPTFAASPSDVRLPSPATNLPVLLTPLSKQKVRSVSSTIRSVSQHRPQRLYSRSDDQERLVQLYRKSIAVSSGTDDSVENLEDDETKNNNEETTALLIISGVSGVGKTTLAISLESTVLADQGFFVRAQCSQTASSNSKQDDDPLTSYKSILQDLMKQLFSFDRSHHSSDYSKWQTTLCSQIRKAAGEEMTLLERVVPSMKQIRALLHRLDSSHRSHRRLRSMSVDHGERICHPVHAAELDSPPATKIRMPLSTHLPSLSPPKETLEPEDPEAAVGTNTLSVRRFEYAFQKILKAVASPQHPLVILIDDVQWARTSNNLLEEQLNELASSGMGGLFFIMTYRVDESEVQLDTTLLTEPRTLHDVQLQQRLDRTLPHIQQHHWSLSGLTPQAIHELLVDTLSLERGQLDHLSRTVFDLTQGNVLFVLEILRAFQEDELLSFDETQNQWICDHHLIRQHPILQVQTLTDLYRAKILDLPEDAQEVLKICACLGTHFLWTAAKQVVGAFRKELVFSTAWGLCEQAHLVKVSDERDNTTTSRHASFAHDSIHQAAYHLIPQDQREAWHLKIGQTLWHETTGEEFDTFLFVILEQIFLGEAQIAEMEDRIAVASLCLHAGETAVKTSGFELSATYLEKGIGLLGPSKWRKNNTYDLCLGLFNNAIDTCYATGQMDRVESLIQEVLENARVFEDELRARVMLIYTLGTKQEMSAAIERGVETLKRLGEHMEKAPSKLNVRLTLAKARHLLRRNSDAQLMRLVAMTDQRLISVQIVLNVMWLSAYYNNAVLAAMISCRMVELSVQHGASVVSCVGFAMFATMVLG